MSSTTSSPADTIPLITIDCPLCGSNRWRAVCVTKDVTYQVPGEYPVVACQACRHMYLNPRPTDAALMRCYPSDYAPYTASACEQQAQAEAARGLRPRENPEPAASPSLLRRLLRAVPGVRPTLRWLGEEQATYLPAPPQAGSQLLELGCAHGGYLSKARELGWQVDGVEPSREACESARRRGLQVFCGRLHEAGLPDDSRDMLAAWMVLEHVPDPAQVLQQAARILRPEGVLALSVPNAGAWERHVFGRYWLGYDPPRHLQHFTPRRLTVLLQAAGFEQVRIIHQSNVRYWWGSLAAWGKARYPHRAWPDRWLHYFRTEPPARWQWWTLVPAKLLAIFRMSGRITLTARRSA